MCVKFAENIPGVNINVNLGVNKDLDSDETWRRTGGPLNQIFGDVKKEHAFSLLTDSARYQLQDLEAPPAC